MVGSERAYRMFNPDPDLFGTDILEDYLSDYGKELQIYHIVKNILQLSDETSPLYNYFVNTTPIQ